MIGIGPSPLSGAKNMRFVITPRLLRYGIYHIQMNASMLQKNNDTEIIEFVEGTLSTLDGYFQIKACDVVAKIKGGNGKAVAYFGKIFHYLCMYLHKVRNISRKYGTDTH